MAPSRAADRPQTCGRDSANDRTCGETTRSRQRANIQQTTDPPSPHRHPLTLQSTFSVGVEGVEPMLGSGMLLTSSKTFCIFLSEIFTCSRGSSPATLNLTSEQRHQTWTCWQIRQWGNRRVCWSASHLGILESFSTIHLAKWTVKSMGWRMCCRDEACRRADFHILPGKKRQLTLGKLIFPFYTFFFTWLCLVYLTCCREPELVSAPHQTSRMHGPWSPPERRRRTLDCSVWHCLTSQTQTNMVLVSVFKILSKTAK